jgi:hypothetical protein
MSALKNANPLKPIKVSARDRAIYEAVMIDQKPQRTVAIEYKLSQPRVNAIVVRMTRWLSQGDPPGLNELYRRDRLRAVSRLHRMQLTKLHHEAVEAWHKSGDTTHTVKERVVKGEVVSRETTVHTRLRDRRYLADICAIADRIVAFEGFDELGNVDESCEGRLYEEPERTPVDGLREVKRRVMAGVCDTPGDEGIPGMWTKEMEQRNAVVKKKQQGEGRQNVEGRMQNEEGKAVTRECETPAKPPAERQLGELSLSPVLRGEGRGEGPELREDAASSTERETQASEKLLSQEANINDPNPKHTSTIPAINSEQVLSQEITDSAQVPPQPVVTSSQPAPKVLSDNPPKVPRFRLMGTIGEMVESLGYDDYFDPLQRMMRA